MKPEIQQFFQDYVDAFNRSLAGPVDTAAIRGAYAPCFVATGPTGVISADNDESFAEFLEKGYSFYRSIGTRRMILRGVELTEIDEHHQMARVSFSSEYGRPDGEAVTIDFDLTYMLQIIGEKPEIFAYVAGDEEAVLREHGLVP